jgi:cation:H+ antiporter
MKALEIFLLFFALLCSVYLLMYSAKKVQNGLIIVTKKAHLKEFFLGFLILGIFTNMPETLIALISANSAPELSLGNLLGGAAILLTLGIGSIVVKFGSIRFPRRIFREGDFFVGLIQVFFILFVLIDLEVNLVESIILILFYILYIRSVAHRFNIHVTRSLFGMDIKSFFNVGNAKLYISVFVSVILLLVSANVIVEISKVLATALSIPIALVGIFVLGVGTNIPEIAILLTSNKDDRSEKELALGSVLGSVFIRTIILGVLGLVSGGFVIKDYIVIVPTIVILSLALLMLIVFVLRNKDISRVEGIMLLALYASLIVSEVLILFN